MSEYDDNEVHFSIKYTAGMESTNYKKVIGPIESYENMWYQLCDKKGRRINTNFDFEVSECASLIINQYFYKYYDKNLSFHKEQGNDEFEFYGANYFTPQITMKVLEDIKSDIKVLKNKENEKELSKFILDRKLWDLLDSDSPWFFLTYKLEKEELTEFVKLNIDIVVSFYDEFIFRIKEMFKLHPEATYFVIMGP